MVDTNAIREHMEVIGAEGTHVGTVDKVEGQRIKLTKSDRGSGGKHHYLPIALVAGIEGDKLRLSATAETAVDLFEEGTGDGGG